jgi:hypothetical protein
MNRVASIEPQWVTTGLTFEGHRIVRYRGVVRGIVVRSRSLVGNLGASIQTLFGGNITLYTELCERARLDAFELMLRHGAEHGPTRSSACATTPTRWPRASPRSSPTAPQS